MIYEISKDPVVCKIIPGTTAERIDLKRLGAVRERDIVRFIRVDVGDSFELVAVEPAAPPPQFLDRPEDETEEEPEQPEEEENE